jgi:hypothetical protein
MIGRTLILTLGTLALGLHVLSASAQDQASRTFCGDIGSKNPVIEPGIPATVGYTPTDDGFDCHAWQVFIGLNWPALPGPRGFPNKNAKLGAPGTTVWETFKTVEQTFLPNAIDPGPWNDAPQLSAAVPTDAAARVNTGELRALIRTSKVSRQVIANVVRAGIDPTILESITQAGGGTLFDQQSQPVYYEIAMNADQYNYIQRNGLFDAQTQLTFATTKTIALPGGVTEYGDQSAVELKAAWKILTPAEISSGKFHTAQAILLSNASRPVTVGLVGLHIFQMSSFSAQGMWATFAHDDNAPVQGNLGVPRGTFTFYNPDCKPAPCAINSQATDPTQVVQMFKDSADIVNAKMKAMLQAYGAGPWQYYKLINVQWPQNPKLLSALPIPAMVALPDGNPNTDTLVNPVLETYKQKEGTGCFRCHVYATISSAQSPPPQKAPQNAASYSFSFGYAQVPAPK